MAFDSGLVRLLLRLRARFWCVFCSPISTTLSYPCTGNMWFSNLKPDMFTVIMVRSLTVSQMITSGRCLLTKHESRLLCTRLILDSRTDILSIEQVRRHCCVDQLYSIILQRFYNSCAYICCFNVCFFIVSPFPLTKYYVRASNPWNI